MLYMLVVLECTQGPMVVAIYCSNNTNLLGDWLKKVVCCHCYSNIQSIKYCSYKKYQNELI